MPLRGTSAPEMLKDTYKHRGMRRALADLLRRKGITDERVLEAVASVPRHAFFESAFWEHAYQDKAFAIGEGQTISQPFTVATQTELLALKSGDKVLEIGTGSGYQCCILQEMGAKVVSIEYNRTLHGRARIRLERIGYEKARLIYGDGTRGFASEAPYNAIIVTAGAPAVPSDLLGQLSVGGRLVIPVGEERVQQMLRLTLLPDRKVRKESFGEFSFVPLLGQKGWK